MTNRDTDFLSFIQIHIDLIQKQNPKLYFIGTSHFTNFGNDFIRIDASPIHRDDTYWNLKCEGNSYYSFTVRSKDERNTMNNKSTKEYFIQQSEKDFKEIENNILLFVCVIKSLFPNLIILNKCKYYSLSDDFINSERFVENWFEEKNMHLRHPNLNPNRKIRWRNNLLYINYVAEEIDQQLQDRDNVVWSIGFNSLKKQQIPNP